MAGARVYYERVSRDAKKNRVINIMENTGNDAWTGLAGAPSRKGVLLVDGARVRWRSHGVN